jgi:DNA-binding response OmpR family regulator
MTPLATVAAPLARPAPAAAPKLHPVEPTAVTETAAGRVLVLDADTERRELLADVVTRAGGKHALAASGAQAIEQLREDSPRCLLVAALPDGARAAFVAWARSRHPHLPIVAIADGVEHATELYNAGADIVTTLPIDPDLLGAKLAAAIRRAQRPHLRLV